MMTQGLVKKSGPAAVSQAFCHPSKTSPELLAEAVLSNIDKEVNYTKIPINGSKEIAKRINDLL